MNHNAGGPPTTRTHGDTPPVAVDLISLDGPIKASTRSRLGGAALAAALLVGGAWSVWGSDTVGETTASAGSVASQNPAASSPDSSHRPCYIKSDMIGATTVGSLANEPVPRLRSCIRDLRSLERAALRALAERPGILVHHPVRPDATANSCRGIPATADTAQQWITSGHYPDCAR